MNDSPVLTIVMPVYNRAAMLREAVASVVALGAELSWELVIVDDCSTDDTWQTIRAYDDARIRSLRLERNSGQSTARNHGLAASKGRYVKFLDSDDLLEAAHVAKEIDALERDHAEIAVSGWSDRGPGKSQSFEAPRFTSIVDDVLDGRAVPTSAALYVRHPDWQWDPQLRKLDDWDYFCQAALRSTKITSVPGSAYVMRHHEGPRATDATMLANAREHHVILHKIERFLSDRGLLTPARTKRLAQYFYKEVRVLSLHDARAMESALQHILELDPSFIPRDEEPRALIRHLAGILGLRNTVRLYAATIPIIRRLKQRF